MHPIIDQLSNDATMAGVDVMCGGCDTVELSEVSFVFIKIFVALRNNVFF